jgi:hypothetical protein
MLASFALEAGKTNGPFIRLSCSLPLGWFVLVRVLLGL